MDTGSPLDTWIDAWRARHPQLEPAWTFLHDNERARYGAFEALKQEWLDAVYAIREPQIAITKLQWWREELHLAQRGQARHPLTQALFADEAMRALPIVWWSGAIDAALLSLDAPPAADFTAQCARTRLLHEVLARIETALWFGADADASRAIAVAVVGHLIDTLRHWSRETDYGRSPLPMALLARHGLTQAALGNDTPARRGAIRDQIIALKQALAETDKMPSPLSLFRGLQACRDRRALRRAADATDPLSSLHKEQGGFRSLLDAWRAARVWRSSQS